MKAIYLTNFHAQTGDQNHFGRACPCLRRPISGSSGFSRWSIVAFVAPRSCVAPRLSALFCGDVRLSLIGFRGSGRSGTDPLDIGLASVIFETRGLPSAAPRPIK